MSPDVEWHTDEEDKQDAVVTSAPHKRTHWRVAAIILAVCLGIAFGVVYRSLPEPLAHPASTKTPTALEVALGGKSWSAPVTVGGSYCGAFLVAYEQSFQDFEEETGIRIVYEPIDYNDPEFVARVEAGTGLDLVEFEYPGAMRKFARDGKIIDVTQVVDLETLRTRYDQNWLD